jgi:CRISPR-associated protein Cas5d
MTYDTPVEVKVWGEFACFTRPEMKAERVSYPMMTPTAARGVLEAIYWKPEFQWVVEEIWVLHEVQFFSILRNEVTNKMSARSGQEWSRAGGGYVAAEDRTQRHTLALRDVAYVIKAQPVPLDTAVDAAKYRDQFRRRVRTGRCFQQPFLGCREFLASFSEPDGSERPIDVTGSIGRMLLAMDYAPEGLGAATPRFFDGWLDRGVLRMPPSGVEAA